MKRGEEGWRIFPPLLGEQGLGACLLDLAVCFSVCFRHGGIGVWSGLDVGFTAHVLCVGRWKYITG